MRACERERKGRHEREDDAEPVAPAAWSLTAPTMYGEMCAIGASACTTIPEASAPAAAEASPSVARSSTVAMVWEQQQGKQARLHRVRFGGS